MPESPVARRALWVLAEGHARVLDDPERVPVLVERALALQATDLFVQVYRGGRAWYDAGMADPTPYRKVVDASGRDPLRELIGAAHAAGLKVHAWVNVLSLARNRDALLLEDLGPDVVQMDRHGRSLLDYPGFEVPQPDRRTLRMGTPGLYLDPAAPGLAPYLAAVYAELLQRYPGLDGLHLDYIRYPDVLPISPGSRFGVGLDFGYGAATRARFQAETGLEAPFGDVTQNASRWDHWRRERVREVVTSIASQARATRPGLEVSAAVFSYMDRAYLSLGQDWRGWLEDGLIDLAVPMSYTTDNRLFRYHAEHFASLQEHERIIMGLGSWLFSSNPAGALEQMKIARRAGITHLALFSYDSIVASEALRNALVGDSPP